MRKYLVSFLLLIFTVLGLSACTGANHHFATVADEIAAFPAYRFTAVGKIQLHTAEHLTGENIPLSWASEGTRAQDGSFEGTLHYADDASTPLFSLPFVTNDHTQYFSFVPYLQTLLDYIYPEDDFFTLRDLFEGNPFASGTNFDITHLPIHLESFLRTILSSATLDTNLSEEEGIYTLQLTQSTESQALLDAMLAPFTLLIDISQAFDMQNDALLNILNPVQRGNIADFTLEIAIAASENGFTAWLTLSAPDLMTITADITYHAVDDASFYSPLPLMPLADMQEAFTAHHNDLSWNHMLTQNDLEIITGLPELHMLNHNLESELLLTPVEIQIGGEYHYVSLIAGGQNHETDIGLFSLTDTMTIFYTTLPAESASETIVPFVLDYLDISAYDAENFMRTPMRINAHDTAAVKALYFDDNHTGRTLHIYVLQNLEDSNYALFLSITIFLEHISNHTVALLDQLGFHIGIDFAEYLALARDDASE